MNRWMVLFALLLVSAVVAISCSGGNSASPVLPATDPELTDGSEHTGQTQTHLWGYYDIYIDIENQTADVVVNRSVMFAANVVDFLNDNPAGVGITNLETPLGPDYVDVLLDVLLTHPLPLAEYNGYDVRGIFCGDGSATLAYNGDLDYQEDGTDQTMMNEDGFSRWFNYTEFSTPGLLGYTPGAIATPGYEPSATLMPYKYFADGLGANDDLWAFLTTTDANGVFSAGQVNARHYEIRFPLPTPGVSFGYAVVANWVDETTHPANAPEAMGCETFLADSIYYVDDLNKGGDIIADISLFGWAGAPSTIYIESSVLSAVYTFDSVDMTPVSSGPNYSTYHVEIPADNITHNSSTADGEMWVIAEYSGSDYTNDLGVPNGADTDALAAFFKYNFYIADESYCTPPTSVTGISISCLYLGSYVTDIEITGSGFLDVPGLTAYLDDGVNSVEFTNVTFNNSTQITADLDIGSLPAGDYDVVVSHGPGCDAVDPTAFTVDNIDWTSASDWDPVGYDSTYDIRNHPAAIPVSLTDDSDTNPIPIGFDYDYYGITYTQFIIGSNGMIVLQNSGDGMSASGIVTDCNDETGIIPFGEDLNPATGGTIWFLGQGTAPDRTLTVQFNAVRYFGSSDYAVNTFSATLFETTNMLRFQYESVDVDGSTGYQSSVAMCNSEPGYPYQEGRDELFCANNMWPIICPDYRAYEIETPGLSTIPGLSCTYADSSQSYSSSYECSGSATVLPMGDDTLTGTIPIGFSFDFNGTSYTTVRISSNAYFLFGSSFYSSYNQYCTSSYTYDMVCAIGDDLHPGNGGQVKYETRTVGSDQVFIAEWEAVPSYYNSGSNTCQIVLFNGTDADCDDILIQWQQIYDSATDAFVNFNLGGGQSAMLCLFSNGTTTPTASLIAPQ